MQLDILSLDLITSRWPGKDAQSSIKARVVPADHDAILIGDRHVFAKHTFKSDVERIDALLLIMSDGELLENVKGSFPQKLQKEQDPAGYASVYIPNSKFERPSLSIVLLIDEFRLGQLFQQIDGLVEGSIKLKVWIEGLEFGVLPDETIWKCSETDQEGTCLPIRQYSIDVAKLRTTRQAINDAEDLAMYNELSDSDDPEERKQGKEWLTATKGGVLEEAADPQLALLRHCRALLVLLLLCVVVGVLQRL